MSSYERTVQRRSPAARAAKVLLGAVAAETAITVLHFMHGAHTYGDPGRLHVVLPAVVALTLAAALTGLFLWRPGNLSLAALLVITAIPFVGVFGLFHGAYSHGLKLILFFAGAPKETLEWLFMSPDYALPDDFMFEFSGVLTAAAATVVGYRMLRLIRDTGHHSGNGSSGAVGGSTSGSEEFPAGSRGAGGFVRLVGLALRMLFDAPFKSLGTLIAVIVSVFLMAQQASLLTGILGRVTSFVSSSGVDIWIASLATESTDATDSIPASRVGVAASTPGVEIVRAGQLLAMLEDSAQRDSVDLARADLAEAEAALARIEHGATPEELRQARADVEAAAAHSDLARSAASRTTRLHEQGAVPDAEADRAIAESRSQTAQAERAEARLQELKRGARAEDRSAALARAMAAQARLRLAESNLARRRIAAPIAGTILLSRFHAGEFYNLGAGPLFVLGDMSRLQVRLEVDEIDALAMSRGAPCALYSDAGARLAQGAIVRLAPKMRRRALPLESPTARADVRVREVFVEIPAMPKLIPGQRVWGHVSRTAISEATSRHNSSARYAYDAVPAR